jgi:hypothetical protein
MLMFVFVLIIEKKREKRRRIKNEIREERDTQ